MSERTSFPTLDSARLQMLRLGAFILLERLGVGGMSEVWRAVHEDSKAIVAVKLLSAATLAAAGSSKGLGPGGAIQALRREILLMARLDHPGVLRVLEFGMVTGAESRRSEGVLTPGSPYLVTPWARGGSLDRAPRPADFGALSQMLRSLLLALAHAHARGVIHRDIKPANILLLGDPSDGTARPVLSDFGISFALARTQEGQHEQVGTPAYMAPEQILGPPLEQGPTTDLYALGCVTHRLATGHAPFVGATEDVLRSHVLAPAPPLRATIAVPEGFAEWVAVLLAKQPHQRFPSAAFARHALESLSRRSAWVAPHEEKEPESAPRAAIAEAVTALQMRESVGHEARTLIATGISSGPPAVRASSHDLPSKRPRLSFFPPAPPPSTWRSATTPLARISVRPSAPPRPSLPDFDLLGAGLGLYGLRRLDIAGRERERDQLYQMLLEVHRDGLARAVVLRGATGIGTTRLGEWLLETASELDAGTALRVGVGDARTPGDALIELLERVVGARGLPRAQIEARTKAWARDAALSATEAQDLWAVLCRDSTRFRYPSERLLAARRALSRAAPRHPLVVLLDDAVQDPECLELVRSALAGEERISILFVLTASSELIDPTEEGGEERARALFAVARDPRGLDIALGPLPPDDHGALVEGLLGLEPSLAREVVERTEGRPLFAVQLVGDWVARGLLVPGIAGFTLREGATVDVPDDIHALYSSRLREASVAIAQRSSEADAEEALVGLELAAVLSPTPLDVEWYAVLDAANVRAAQALPELATRGLIRQGRDRFTINHRMLRESLIRRAREAGRYTAHHRVIAEVLTRLGADPSRLAAHRIEGGDLEGALAPLLASATLRIARSDLSGALESVRRHGEVLDSLGAPPTDPRRATALLHRAEVLAHSHLEEAAASLDAIHVPELGLEPASAARLAWLRGVIAQKRGQTHLALQHFELALTTIWAAPGLDDEERDVEPRALYGVAESAKLIGDLDRSEDAYEAVQARIEEGDRLYPLVLQGMSDLENRRGNTDRALELGRQALELLDLRGARQDAAIARNAMGDIERRRGNLRAAEAYYLAALSIFDVLGSQDAAFTHLNLALLSVAEHTFERAEAELTLAEAGFMVEARRPYARLCALIRLPCLAVRGETSAMRRVLDEQSSLLESMIDPDLAWCLEQAHALGGGGLDPDVAVRLESYAASQRRRLRE